MRTFPSSITKSITSSVIALSLFTACSKNSDTNAANDDPTRKATAEECQQAYAHLADLGAADGKMSKDDLLKLEKSNLDSCPHMETKASIECLTAIKVPVDKLMAARMDCAMKKHR